MRFAFKLAGVVVLVAGLAWVGIETGHGAGHAPAVWWANAALVSVLLLDAERSRTRKKKPGGSLKEALEPEFRRRAGNWPSLLAAGYAGNAVAHLVSGGSISGALGLSACDILQVAIAAYGIAILCPGRIDLTRQHQLIRFLGIAVVLAPVVSALAAGLTLHLLGLGSIAVALLWLPPSALGMSIVPPLVLGLARKETRQLFEPRRLGKTLIYLAAVVSGTALIFSRSEFPLLFLVIPPLLLLVVRLGISGGMLGCVLIALAGTDFTVHNYGAELLNIDPALEHRIVLLQLFVATAVLSVSVVGVVLEELKRASRDVQASELRYRSLAASMEMLASIDPLTHIANRRRFDEALQMEWQRAMRTRAPLSLVLFDADFFKAYNDRFGHMAGDECLRKIADRMAEGARRPADLVARFGGEEFALLLPHTPPEGARMLAEQVRKAVEQLAFPLPEAPAGVVTVSGGCATAVPDLSESPLDLLHAADAALYEAKHNGRNRIEVLPEAQALAPAE